MRLESKENLQDLGFREGGSWARTRFAKPNGPVQRGDETVDFHFQEEGR